MAEEARVFSADGDSLLDLTEATVKDRQIVMKGKLMGAWESTMYVPPESVLAAIRILLNWQIVWFVLCLPLHLTRSRK